MSTLWTGALALTAALVAVPALAVQIDSFESPASVTGPSGGLVVSETSQGVSGAIGLARQVDVGGSLSDGAATVAIDGGSFAYSQSETRQGFGGVAWTFFTDPRDLNDFEGHPFDLTEGGTIDAFAITVVEQGIDGYLSLGVQSACAGGCAGLSQWFVPLHGPGAYLVPFPPFLPGYGFADLTHAVVIGLSFESYGGAAGSIRLGPLSTVPEPPMAAFLVTLIGGVLALTRSRPPR